MYSTLLAQRNIVADAIRTADLLVPSTIKTTVYRKVFRTETMNKASQSMITVCGLGFDEQAFTRATKQTELSVQVCMEAYYANDDNLAEKYILATEQLATICSALPNWIANRMSMDEHGLPYQFHVVREQSIYQAIFDVVFNIQAHRSPQDGS